MAAIFRTTSQALHFSYVIQQYPAAASSQMPSIIATIRREMGAADEPHPSTTINLRGLQPAEVRHQCADIRATVRSRLPLVLAQVIEARYSEDRDVKRLAIRALSEHFAGRLNMPADCTLALAWRHYMPADRRDRDFTCRQIGASYGISKDRIHRAALRLAKALDTLQDEAINCLAPGYATAGIVEPL